MIHRDTLHSVMTVVSRLCSKMEPQDVALECCVESLSTLLKHEDQLVIFFERVNQYIIDDAFKINFLFIRVIYKCFYRGTNLGC